MDSRVQRWPSADAVPAFTYQQTTLPLDATWHMPNSPRSALAEYLNGPRIPNARRFDLDEVAELSVGKNPLSLTHMLPSAERFKKELGKHRISLFQPLCL